MDVPDVFLPTTSSVNVQGVSLITPSNPSSTLSNISTMDWQSVRQSIYIASCVECARCIPLHCQQCRRAKCTHFHLHTFFVNAGMQDCPASGQLGTGMKNNADAGTGSVVEGLYCKRPILCLAFSKILTSHPPHPPPPGECVPPTPPPPRLLVRGKYSILQSPPPSLART